MGLKLVLLIRDRAGIMSRQFIKYILIIAKWKQVCIFLLKIILKSCTTFIGVSFKFQVHIDTALHLKMQ